jgi:mRNA-degrading endonuclease RelE of RelBE toxin-antitoxin system
LTEQQPYELDISPRAVRVLQHRLSEAVAAAIVEFIRGDLAHEPKRVGKPMRHELTGLWSARRGAYRVLYEVNDDAKTVRVVRVDHRRDVYRR